MNNPEKCVLIADRDQEFVWALSYHCESAGLRVLAATTARDACQHALIDSPDLLCLGEAMRANDEMSVFDVFLKDEQASRIPMILFTDRNVSENIPTPLHSCIYQVSRKRRSWRRISPIVEELLDVNFTADTLSGR